MDEISEFLLFTMTDGGHFGFYALENSARPFKRGVRAYFFTNTSSYLKQPSNVTCRRLVMESWFWTLLQNNVLYVLQLVADMLKIIFDLEIDLLT